jgi:ankyrin repeat protein
LARESITSRDHEHEGPDLLSLARLGNVAALRDAGAALLEPLEEYPFSVWAAAIEADQAGVLALCLQRGLPVNGADEEVPLVNAAAHRAYACLELLLERGADVDRSDPQGRVGLSTAFMAGDEAAVDRLLRAGANPFFPGHDWVLHVDSSLGKEARALRRRGLKAQEEYRKDTEAERELADAAGAGDAEAVARLLDEGRDPDFRDLPRGGKTALMLAAAAGHASVVELLLRRGASPSLSDRDSHERKRGRGSTLEIESTFSDWTALHHAAASNRASTIRALVAGGADPEERTSAGDTALHLAALNGKPAAVSALLKLGADPNSRNRDQSTPLLIAAYFGPLKCVRALLQAGADLHARDSEGYTPILAACWEDKAHAAEVLVKAGASLADRDAEGGDIWDALHSQGRTATLRALLELGLDVNLPRENGSPLESAAEYNHLAAIPALLKHGARPASAEAAARIAAQVAGGGWYSSDADQAAAIDALAQAGLLTDLPPAVAPSPMTSAARSGGVRLLDRLFAAGVPVDGPPGAAPVAQPLDRKVYQWFISHGANLSGTDAEGLTAVDHAVRQGDAPSTKLLLEAGADPYHRDHAGLRTVEKALACSTPTVARLFRSMSRSDSEIATLRLAQSFHDAEPDAAAIDALLARGADPNVAVIREYPAPLVAAANGWWPVYEALTRAGAAPHPLLAPFLALRDLKPDPGAEWDTLLAEMEAALCTPPTLVGGGHGAVGFRLDAQIQAREDELVAAGQSRTKAHYEALSSVPRQVAAAWRARSRPFWIGTWRAHPIHADWLLVVPSPDPLVAMAIVKPRAGESDVNVFDMLSKLHAWKGPLDWTLTGVGYDAFSLKLETLPADPLPLARELYEFCSDLVEQGVGTVEALARSITATGEIHFWWD